jgi:anti-sigma factor RsiW
MTADRTPPEHARYDELAVGWTLHALEPEDESLFLAHLTTCDRCATTVDETREVMAAMAADLPQPEPSEGLLQRIRAAVGETEQLPEPPVEAPAALPLPPLRVIPAPRTVAGPQRGWRRALPVGLVAAALAAIVGLGLWNVVLSSDREKLQTTVAEQNAVMHGVLSPGRATIAPLKAPDGKSVATVVARGDEVNVIMQGLAVNDPRSTTYVLWSMDGGNAKSLATFDVTSSQIAMKTVGSGSTGYDHEIYGISLEPGRKAPSLPTEVVATGEVAS